MPKRHDCLARQYGDQMSCHACGLYWDVNDPDPPKCQKDRRPKPAARPGDGLFKVDKSELEARKGLPHELPADLAAEMVKTYQANAGGLAGMRAAYRLFLDRIEL